MKYLVTSPARRIVLHCGELRHTQPTFATPDGRVVEISDHVAALFRDDLDRLVTSGQLTPGDGDP